MSTTYGLPFFLEDHTGSLTSSDYTDINGRLTLALRPTAPHRNACAIFSGGRSVAALDFGPTNALGSVSFPHSRAGAIPMAKYLAKVSSKSKTRRFTASDGQEYYWSQHPTTREWTCTNASLYLVASYTDSLNPEHTGSDWSGCVLTVEEAYYELVVEVLASLLIMRHIAAYNL